MISRWIFIIVLKGRDRMKPIKNNKGVALVTVVLIFLVLVILLAGVMFASVTNQKNAVLSKDHTSAYYVAESGLNVSIEKLRSYLVTNGYSSIPTGQYTTKMSLLDDFITDDLNGDTDNLSQGSYLIQATVGATTTTYILRSTGTVNGISRTVEGTFSFDPIMENKAKAIIAKGNITTASGASIIGPIASLLSPAGSDISITCNGSSTTSINEIYYPKPLPSGSTITVDKKCDGSKAVFDADETVIFHDFVLPTYYKSTDTVVVDGVSKNVLVKITPTASKYTFPALTTGQKGYYIDSLPSSSVTFDLGTSGTSNTIYNLFVSSLNVASNTNLGVGQINVIGNGKLKMHLIINKSNYSNPNSSYQFTWNANINQSLLTSTNPEDISKFQLIIKRGSDFASTEYPTFSIGNSNIFVGSLMMDYVNLSFGNFDFKGFIATLGKSYTISSTSNITGPMWVYAPYANVSISSNGTINGSIIANSVSFTSGATLEYMQYLGPLPPELTLPLFIGGEPVPVGITFKFTNFKEV